MKEAVHHLAEPGCDRDRDLAPREEPVARDPRHRRVRSFHRRRRARPDRLASLIALAIVVLAAYGTAYVHLVRAPDLRWPAYSGGGWSAVPEYRGIAPEWQAAVRLFFSPAHLVDRTCFRPAEWSGSL